jgi:hypothetical protein
MAKTIPGNPAGKPDMGPSKRPPIGMGAKTASAGMKATKKG